MKCLGILILIQAVLLIGHGAAVYRIGNGLPYPLRLHQRSAMYYHPNMMYLPSMSSFNTGGTFTGYLEPQPTVQEEKHCQNCNKIPEEPLSVPDFEETTKAHKVEEVYPLEEETGVAFTTQVPIVEEATTQKTKTKLRPPQKNEEEREEDYEDWPFMNKGKQIPSYNVFFPVMFGYQRPGKSGQGYPGGVTAIANAFSSGKGGVATSHATAFGNPPAFHKRSQSKIRSENND